MQAVLRLPHSRPQISASFSFVFPFSLPLVSY
jgi:hypothetical protein